MASLPSKAKVMRQLPLTHTDQLPARSPVREWRFQPGAFMSSGLVTESRRVNVIRNLLACGGWIPAFDPVSKNYRKPLCWKLLIMVDAYLYKIQSTTLYQRIACTLVSGCYPKQGG